MSAERKATGSSNPSGCVWVGQLAGGQLTLRSDRRPGSVVIDQDEWAIFIQAAKEGEFDLHNGLLPAPARV